MKETVIQRMILDGLTYKRILCWRNQSIPVPIRRGRAIVGLRRADPHTVGMPDIIALYRTEKMPYGFLLGIEVKTERGMQSAEQKIWQARLEENGGRYIVARGWDEVELALNEIKKNYEN